MKTIFIVMIAGIAGILMTAGYSNHPEGDYLLPFDGSVDHVHNIGYIEEEEGLYVAAHTGLKIHRDGGWFQTKGNANDYTGFAAVNQGFFASGRPEAGSELPDPLGLQQSTDGGMELKGLGFEDQANFHLLAAGYRSHELFLLNSEADVLRGEGFYKSTDLGETWNRTSAQGLEGNVTGLALHPVNSSYVAAASSTGIYLSKDGGENFSRLTEKGQTGTAVFLNEEHLFGAVYDGGAELMRYDIHKGERVPLILPLTERDAAVSFAQHPVDDEQFAIYSLQGHIFITDDGAGRWEQILWGNKVQ